jgi:mercuric ion transport protein
MRASRLNASGTPAGVAAQLTSENENLGRQRLLAAGGILGAIAVSSCCVLPFALFTLGISGAWISNLTALEPYQPIFAAVTLVVLGYGFSLVYCKPKVACTDGSYCARPSSGRIARIALGTATVLVVIGLGLPRLAPLFL